MKPPKIRKYTTIGKNPILAVTNGNPNKPTPIIVPEKVESARSFLYIHSLYQKASGLNPLACGKVFLRQLTADSEVAKAAAINVRRIKDIAAVKNNRRGHL